MRLLGLAGSTVYFGTRVSFFTKGPRPQTTQAWAKDLCERCGIDVRVVGTPPPSGVIQVSNHRSYADIIVLGACSQTNFVAKQEIRGWPVLGWAADRAGTVFVQRSSRHSGATAMKSIGDRISAGESVTIFPEGTTIGGPGIGAFQKGVFRLAAQRELPIVPIALEYERLTDAWTDEADSSFLPHFLSTFSRPRVVVRVAFGEPVRDADADRLHATTREWIERNLEVPR